jgi:IPT/TIG domain-containing protein/carboxypeptidase family protein
MNLARLTLPGALFLAACGGSSTPLQSTPTTGSEFTISGTVYSINAGIRRTVAGATVELADAATASWGQYGRLMTDATGRYISAPLTARQYLARASAPGYATSGIVNLGYLDASKTADFELTTAAVAAGPLSVLSVTPTRGSIAGGTTVKVTGTGFQTGAMVAFDGVRGTSVYVENSATARVYAPAHAAGVADVVVTNPSGEAATLNGAYTYASPQSFDFNGTWAGFALAHPTLTNSMIARHSDMDMRITIQNNTLTSVMCGGSTIAIPSPPPAVSSGEFSLTAGGVTMTGRILANAEAGGNINTEACPSTRWNAVKQ